MFIVRKRELAALDKLYESGNLSSPSSTVGAASGRPRLSHVL